MYDDTESSKRRRRPLATIVFYHYAALTACTTFCLSVSIFMAYHLGYFSTFLIYLPFVTVCIPALALFDAAHISTWSRWPSSRRNRLRLCAVWCLFLVFAPWYPSSSPLRNDHPPPPVLPSTNGTYFIAANLYNSAKILPTWTRQMKQLIHHLGKDNVYISIHESYSVDDTKTMLQEFEKYLEQEGIGSNLATEDGRRGHLGLDSHERIAFMAGIRNKALEPLRTLGNRYGRRFSKVIFFNDVYFDWRAIVRLINTKEGEYDLACGLDFDGVGMYDRWVLRDACGGPTKEVWPYFTEPRAVKKLRKGEPIEVATCWNGVAVFDASWFLLDGESDKDSPTTEHSPLPLKFRASNKCTASECYLIGMDMHFWKSPKMPKIYVNPQVKVAYDYLNYLFHTKFEELTLSAPWRVVWQDWIGYRMFGWVSDRIWLKRDRCDPALGDLIFVKPGYCTN
ncbi:capsular associated protein [Coprinopsis cinerea okayama7|uniref:Capsular associated protein n=1 Tax=Coprinopsis cinerea (strain Okayama-7 / 130 / ATCC MYA-4618 / FGSC 9003) TaxID=240176 RepID=A8NKM2_COPC7|nr:capsular associated protein [Coprinopsis cinerea okayama7\|eukprot:XP_001834490.2 capsular associated protein [Coprinopsis cinerea okayama7\